LRRQAGDQNYVEVIAATENSAALRNELSNSGATVTRTAGGLRIQLADESEVDAAIAALRRNGAKLVSVQPMRQSLEELFLD